MGDVLCAVENELVAVRVLEDASAEFVDKATGTQWRMGAVALQEEGEIDVGHVWLRTGRSICEQYPARFRGRREGDRIRFVVLGRLGQEVGSFVCSVRLDGPWVECRIEEVDESLPSLIFPPPIESASLVVPMGVGRWIRKPMGGRFFWRLFSHLHMRWFGGLKPDNDRGWIAVLAENHADAGALAADMTIAPGWLKSLGKWSGDTFPRVVRYRFCTGGYVGLAKAFRAWTIERGLHQTLTEKMERFPAARRLLGGRILSFMQARTEEPRRYEDRLHAVPEDVRERGKFVRVLVSHRDTARIVEEAKRLGMRRGMVMVRGWINGGYDETHPDIWPPEPALGSVDELKALCAQPEPFVAALHDNYQDIYQQSASFPRGVCRMRNGEPMPGGYWAGGQAYILNARDGLAHAKRNWEQIRALGSGAMFIDTTTAVNMYESWEPGNTLTRTQDQAYKEDLLRFYREQGLMLGSEEAADFGIPYVDWLENRHSRTPGESVPLWPLVFHDAAFCGRYVRSATPVDGVPGWLADMLWGYFILWGVRDVAAWEKDRDAFTSTLHVDEWHGRIGASQMMNHRFLTEDMQVEQTEFASGEAIVANFGTETRTVDGVTVRAGWYVKRT